MADLLGVLIEILIILIMIRALLSWLPRIRWQYRNATRWLDRITDPLLKPFLRLFPPYKTGGIDISPILSILVLVIIQRLLQMILG